MSEEKTLGEVQKENWLTPMGLKGVTFDQRIFKQVKIVGQMEHAKPIMNELFNRGWRITRSGPYTDDDLFPKVDSSRFLFIAEMEI